MKFDNAWTNNTPAELIDHEINVRLFERSRLKRVDNAIRMSKAMPRLDSGSRSDKFQVRFGGRTIDEDLMRFYLYFAEHDLDAQEPVVLRQDLVKDRCSQKPCSTVGHGLLHYGLLAKTIPYAKGTSTKDFLVTLNRKFNEKFTWADGGVIVPGLTMVPYEGVGTKYGITGNARAGLRQAQRIDGKTRCVIDHSHGYTHYYYQEFKTIIALSNDHSLSLHDGYLNSIENTEGYREGNISVSTIKNVESDRIHFDTKTAIKVQEPVVSEKAVSDISTAGTKHIEAPDIDPNCDIPGGYVNIDRLLKQVGNYTRHYFDHRGRRGDQLTVKYHPMIYMIDRFGEDFRTIDHEDLAKLNYDFATKGQVYLESDSK